MKDTKFKIGNPGGPGRPPKLKTQVKDFIKKYPYAVETLMETLYEMGLSKDREAAMYIIDRIKGKPKSTTDVNIDATILTPQTVSEFYRMLEEHERRQLTDGSNRGTEEEVSERVHEEEEV